MLWCQRFTSIPLLGLVVLPADDSSRTNAFRQIFGGILAYAIGYINGSLSSWKVNYTPGLLDIDF